MNANFRKDEWLTEQLDKPTFELSMIDFNEITFAVDWEQFKEEYRDKHYFVFSKIDTNAVSKWQCLGGAGFKLVDTNVKFELNRNVTINSEKKNRCVICFSNNIHQKAVGLIARDNVVYSRFHIDPEISNVSVKQIKQNWAENFFVGMRSDKMIVALMNKDPVGFLQLICKGDCLSVDLIVVKKEVYGLGIVTAMISFASENISRSRICAGTQIGNVSSLALWQKLGFFVTDADYIFHYHN